MSEEKLDLRKTISSYLGIVYRAIGYWKIGLLVCVIVTAAGTTYAATRRKVWTSHTRIRVVSARVTGMMEGEAMDQMHQDLESRLKQYTQSRRFLQEIIDEYDLYAEVKTRKNLTDEETLTYMRTKMYWGVYEGDEFGFHFTDHNPDLAQTVCKSLADNFMQQRKVADYSVFRTKVSRVEKQLEGVEARLETAEARVTRFKEVNADLIKQMRREQIGGGSLIADPELAADGPSSETKVTRYDSPQLRRLRIRLRALEESASRLRAKQSVSSGARDSQIGDQRATVARELQSAQQRYSKLRAQYTEEFPDVRRAKARVTELQRRKREVETRFREHQATTRSPSAELAAAQREIERTREEVRRLQRREASERSAKAPAKAPAKVPTKAGAPPAGADLGLADGSSPLKSVPEVATHLKRLETEIQPLRDQYQKLHAQKLELEFQAQQREEGGMQYIIIDPANRPSKPSGPHRAKMALASAAGGLVFALAVMALLGFVDNRIYRAEDLDRVEHIPLLATVPDYEDVVSEIAALNEEVNQGPYDQTGQPMG